jgi:hypothetical protein
MEITINNVYPWGRSFDEYRQMFNLGEGDLNRRILGCADGPAAFNAGMNRLGHRVVSVDPLYRFDAERIRARVEMTYDHMLQLVTRDARRFVWDVIRSPQELGELRLASMREFLADYEDGRRAGRYVAEAVPHLSFADGSFDLALCSHFLFLYSQELSTKDHLKAIVELCRVADEVRIFPLLDMQGSQSQHVDPVSAALRANGFQVDVQRVPYEFQKGGNEMMRITRAAII